MAKTRKEEASLTENEKKNSEPSKNILSEEKSVAAPHRRQYTTRPRSQRLRQTQEKPPVISEADLQHKQPQQSLSNEDIELEELDFDEELPEELLNPPKRKVGFIPVLGELLFELGLSVEVVLVRFFRGIKKIFVSIFSVIGYLLSKIFGMIFSGIKKIVLDTKEAFHHVFNALRNLPKIAKAKKQEYSQVREQDTQQTISGYLVSGVKSHGYLLTSLWHVVLPIICVVGFAFLVKSMLFTPYGLDVTINNTSIGYVQDETVLEDALNLLRMRVSLEKGQDIAQWEVSPEISIGHANEMLSKTEIADKILQSSSEDIQKGYGIYVDGFLVGATEDGSEIVEFLDAKKQPYYNNQEYSNAEVSFVRDITVSETEEVFLTNSLKPVDELEEELEVNVSEEETHIVEEGETLKSIAYEEKILYTELIARNPEMADKKENYEPPVGTSLLIQNAQPYLQVKTVYEYTQEEEIPYETVEEETDSRVIGEKKRVQKGEDGKQEVSYQVTIIDGEQVATDRIDDKVVVLQEATPEIYEVGTKEASEFYTGEIPGNISGSGSFIWPVPAYSYSSRGYNDSHGGLDINAATGTPIYASSGGVVTFAGTGTGSYWSYGNFVQIQHDNGMVTRYAHCSSVAVSAGDVVSQGQFIGSVGSTGLASGPHCHFETIVNGTRVNPYNYVSAP